MDVKEREYIISRDKVLDLLNESKKFRTVIAPIKNEFGDVLFMPIKDTRDIVFDYGNTLNSVKEYFLPDSEAMFSFGSSMDIDSKVESEEILIFGLRPCDTKALVLLDRFFERNFRDNIYFRKREGAIVVTLACPEYHEDCFCVDTGSGPILENGYDFQLIPLGKKFLLQIGDEIDGNLVEKILPYVDPLSENDRSEFLKLKEYLRKYKKRFKLERVHRNLKNNTVDAGIWKDIASRCQSCGLCLFICPTCSCFTVNDRIRNSIYERIRQWDACYFMGFTRLAGGFNPVMNKEEMVKRKYQHKLSQQIDEFGMSGCTGCGRCNKCCVGNVNWLENIKKIDV